MPGNGCVNDECGPTEKEIGLDNGPPKAVTVNVPLELFVTTIDCKTFVTSS
jgi:hypothetical protein